MWLRCSIGSRSERRKINWPSSRLYAHRHITVTVGIDTQLVVRALHPADVRPREDRQHLSLRATFSADTIWVR